MKRVDTREEVRRAAAFFPTLECTHSFTPRIVEEVRSIRFNQEQEEEILHKQMSMSLSTESRSSLDLREMACQQDLITALISMDKVQLPSPIQSMLTPPPRPVQPLPHWSRFLSLSRSGLPSRLPHTPAVTTNLPIELWSFSERLRSIRPHPLSQCHASALKPTLS